MAPRLPHLVSRSLPSGSPVPVTRCHTRCVKVTHKGDDGIPPFPSGAPRSVSGTAEGSPDRVASYAMWLVDPAGGAL